MPKYYRFRATTPTRKARQIKEKDIKKEVEKFRATTPTRKVGQIKEKDIQQEVQKAEQPYDVSEDFMDLERMCDGPAWYRRRIAWRQGPTLRQLSDEAGRDVLRFIKNNPGILETPSGSKPHNRKPYSLGSRRGNNS